LGTVAASIAKIFGEGFWKRSSTSEFGTHQPHLVRRLRRMSELEESRWRAITERDESLVGCFVYGVTSTKIYCRPGCGARRPLRRNTEFFATSSEASAKGYRACRRCRPDEVVVSDPSLEAVIAACRLLERPDHHESASTIASRLGYSERHLRRRFLEIIGVTMSAYERAQKAERVRTDLRQGRPVMNAVIDAGYGSTRAFYEHGAPRLGMSPGRYRDGGRGEQIRYAVIDSVLGSVVVAATEQGVCSVKLGSDVNGLVSELKMEFPLARIARDDEGLCDVAAVLDRATRGEGGATQLPLDLAGTAFQIRVWEALRRIPPGETRTYSDVAEEIGAPRAVRAVASACAANEAALAIPCHRVIRRDGSLGGYRWGLSRKEALLAAEAVATVVGVD
jgi:AraC family transcriptional regulator, regulatory protein of adaptative response / methylated-DNA-[protein]-cysteine methyltransferase